MNKILLDFPENIITPRLILRHSKAGDGKAIHNMISDGYEDAIKWLGQPSILPNEQYFEIEARKHHAEWILRNDMRLLIINKQSNMIIGRASYPPHLSNWDIPYFGISYLLANSYQGKGYATEAVNAMIKFAFTYMNARKIEIKCDIENIKSKNIPQRLNMPVEYTSVGTWPRKDKAELAKINTYSLFNLENLPKLDISFE